MSSSHVKEAVLLPGFAGACITKANRLLTKSFQKKAWLWLADANTSANHSQALCKKLLVKMLLALVTQAW